MSNEPEADPPDPLPPDEPKSSAAGIASIERAFLRLTFWQTLLSLAGVFTGAVALYAALNESQAVRQQTSASVWPYVQLMIDDTDDGEAAHFALSLENVGVGPARMISMQLTLAGEPVHTWEEATARATGTAARVGIDYGRSSVSRRVIAPGESVEAFQTRDRALALAMQAAVYGGQTAVRYCFCSIFDECWLGELRQNSAEASVDSVEVCPSFGTDAFRD